MKTLGTTAADETEPEEVREAAREAVEAIDRGAPVRNGYDRVKEMRRSVETSTVEPERKRANDPTEYLTALAAKHTTFRLAYENEASEKYASASSLASAAHRAGVAWAFTAQQ